MSIYRKKYILLNSDTASISNDETLSVESLLITAIEAVKESCALINYTTRYQIKILNSCSLEVKLRLAPWKYIDGSKRIKE